MVPHGVHLLQFLVKPILTILAVLPSMIMYKNNTAKVEWIIRKKVQKTVIEMGNKIDFPIMRFFFTYLIEPCGVRF